MCGVIRVIAVVFALSLKKSLWWPPDQTGFRGWALLTERRIARLISLPNTFHPLVQEPLHDIGLVFNLWYLQMSYSVDLFLMLRI